MKKGQFKTIFLQFSLWSAFAVAVLSIVVKRYPEEALNAVDDVFAFINRHTPPLTQKRYLEGNFAPCEEPLTATDLSVVSGELPANLTGTYIRNSANIMFTPPSRAHHMFDGESLPHRVRFGGGKALRYDRSWLDSPRYKILLKYGREADTSFGDILRGGYFFLAKFILARMRVNLGLVPDMPIEYYGTHSTSIIGHHEKLLAATEVSYALGFELGDQSGAIKADPAGAQPFQGSVVQKTVFSAHPKICPRTGDMFFISKTPSRQATPMVGLNHLTKDGKLQQSVAGPVVDTAGTTPAFVHDFWLTQHFAIFFDASLRSDVRQIPRGGKMFSWQEQDNLRFGILPRDAASFEDDIIWCQTDSPGFIFHIINGWETTKSDEEVSFSIFAPKFSEYPATIPIHTPEEPPSRLTRWDLKINVTSKTCISVSEVQMRNDIVERPSTNLRFHGSPHAKWAFLRSEGIEESESMGGTILKVNLKTGELAATFNCEANEPCVTGEALYVPKDIEFMKEYPFVGPEGVAGTEQEDDGYLLDMVYYPGRNTSELVVWDAAASGTAFPITRIALPERVPYGVHAWFVPPHLHSASF